MTPLSPNQSSLRKTRNGSVGRVRRGGVGSGSGGVWSWLFCALFVVVLLLAAACGGESEDWSAATTVAAASVSDEAMVATTVVSSPSEDAASAGVEEAADGESSLLASADAGLPAATPADLGRDVIYRGTVSVRARDVGAASREAVSIVEGLGGFVFGQQVSSSPEPESRLTFKVMPADFMSVLESLSGVERVGGQAGHR